MSTNWTAILGIALAITLVGALFHIAYLNSLITELRRHIEAIEEQHLPARGEHGRFMKAGTQVDVPATELNDTNDTLVP